MTQKKKQTEVSQLKHARRQYYTGKLTINKHKRRDETTANHSRTGTGHTNSTTGLKCQNWANTRLVSEGGGCQGRTWRACAHVHTCGYSRLRIHTGYEIGGVGDVTEVKPYILAMEILETGMECVIVLPDRSWTNYWTNASGYIFPRLWIVGRPRPNHALPPPFPSTKVSIARQPHSRTRPDFITSLWALLTCQSVFLKPCLCDKVRAWE